VGNVGTCLLFYDSILRKRTVKDYLIQVVAVDGGAGWGEFEGRAIVEAKPIYYHSRPFMQPPPPPDPSDEFPKECNASEFCPALATKWAEDITTHVSKFVMPYQDPKSLEPIEIIDDEEDIKKYDDGKLHHLKQFEASIEEAEVDSELPDIFLVNVTLNFRLLRTSYVWQNFFSDGILSMYHTCGQNLPITIFDDVDLEDVEDLVPSNCTFEVNVLLSIGPGNNANVTNVLFNLDRYDFEFDTTWISSHFHDLDQVWSQQEAVLTSALKLVIAESFESAIIFNPPYVWLKNKFRPLDEAQEILNSSQTQVEEDTTRH